MKINFPPNVLLVIAGPSLHGKTTVGNSLAQITNLQHLDVDAIRAEMFPAAVESGGVTDKSSNFDSKNNILLAEGCCTLLVQKSSKILKKNPVVMTGTFPNMEFRRSLLDFLSGSGSYVNAVFVKLDGCLTDKEIKSRINKRVREGSNSPIKSYKLYKKSLKLQESWGDIPIFKIPVGTTNTKIIKKILSLI